MPLRSVVATVVAFTLATAGVASAQSAYVGASVFADVVRVSGPSGITPGNGEAFGGAVRAGVALGGHWGVELEFARSGEMETSPDVRILAEAGVTGSSGLFPAIFPSPRITSTRQLGTLSTVLWWNHEMNDRMGLAFLGGVAFTRTEMDLRVDFPDFPLPDPRVPIPLPMPTRLYQSSNVLYEADVTVGAEGRIGMTEHVKLVPGIRLQTAAGGWAIRPAVGLQWQF